MKRGDGARSGSRPRRRFGARRNRVCHTWWPRPVLTEPAEGPLDHVALLVRGRVEGGRAAAPAAAPQPVLHLVRGRGNGRLDPAPARPGADRGAGVGLVAPDPPGPG